LGEILAKTAWVFPGQGSQIIGMGLDLLATATGKERFAEAEELLGWSVIDCCQGSDRLNQTLYTQPCLYVVSAILTELLSIDFEVDIVAGHSLGEYVALFAAGVFDFATGLKLVQHRARLMDQASDGKMAALVGFDRAQLHDQIAQIEGVVLANDNHAGQVVVSGKPSAVDQLLSQIKVKRAIPLNVSGAFHSPLMENAAQEFRRTLEKVMFKTLQVPVLSNVETTPSIDPEIVKQRLVQQMTGAVRWREICLQLTSLGIGRVIEVGPGKVLTGLIKRTCPEMSLHNVGNLEELFALKSAILLPAAG
jgi:[acyl-carrier-protein] S-malonyltransferase